MTASDGKLNSDDKLLWQELAVLVEEQKMRYVTSVERIGEKIGEIKILARMMTKNYGFDNEKSFSLLQNLNSDDLLEFSDLLFDFDSPDDVRRWVQKHSGRQTGTQAV